MRRRGHDPLRRDLPVVLWALVLAALALGPALGSGYVLVRDMVWVPDLALRSDFLGLGTALPRAVPSDAVVAVLDEIVPGMLLQKLVLLGALAAGGVGVTRLLDPATGGGPRLAAVTLYGWNALVLERLLMGAWPVLVGYAVLPWLLAAALRWSREGRAPLALLVLVPLGCLSASAGLATAVAVLAGAAGRGRTAKALLLLVAGNAPWLVSGLLHAGSATSDARAAAVFALHGEGSVPGPLAALTLGGIWNADVVPGSRGGAVGWLTLVVVAALAGLGAHPWWRRAGARTRSALVSCWVAGFALAVLTWAAPDAVGWLAAHVPGAGVVRDGARILVLCAPLLVVLVASGVAELLARLPAGARVARAGVAVAAVLLPVALLPGLALGAGRQLRPAHFPAAYAEARRVVGDDGPVLVLPLSAYRAPSWNHGAAVLDPLGRFLKPDYVASDVLVVDGVALSGEDPVVTRAAAALAQRTPEARAAGLVAAGIATVVTDRTAAGDAPEVDGDVLLDDPVLQVVSLRDPGRGPVAPRVDVVAMTLAWAAYLGAPLLGVALLWRRSRRRLE